MQRILNFKALIKLVFRKVFELKGKTEVKVYSDLCKEILDEQPHLFIGKVPLWNRVVGLVHVTFI